MKYLILFIASLVSNGLAIARTIMSDQFSETTRMNTQSEVCFVGGCLWGTGHLIKQIGGVTSTRIGYANGETSIKSPTYEQVCNDNAEFAETVEVDCDPRQVDLKLLIELFFKTTDPASINRQGNGIGSRYRIGVCYTNTDDLPTVKETVEALAKNYTKPVVVETQPLSNFYPTEDYHQDYLNKHPDGYCHISPDLLDFTREANKGKASSKPVSQEKFQKPGGQTLHSKLTAERCAVTRQNATERAFRNEYQNEKREGTYVDIATGEPLFISIDKFNSGCGWSSFSKPTDKSLVMEKADLSHGMKRTEIRSKTGDAHLGHVFNGDPVDKGGLRYCINGVPLRFTPKAKMKKEGYADYLSLL